MIAGRTATVSIIDGDQDITRVNDQPDPSGAPK
jgi:hypothetical protein